MPGVLNESRAAFQVDSGGLYFLSQLGVTGCLFILNTRSTILYGYKGKQPTTAIRDSWVLGLL